MDYPPEQPANRGPLIRRFLGMVIFLLIWTLSVPQSTTLIPSLPSVIARGWEMASSGPLFSDGLASALRVTTGVLLAVMVAAVGGCFAAAFRPMAHYLSGVVDLLRPIPPIAWTPLAIVTFGVGPKSAVAIVALGAFFPIWAGTVQGLQEARLVHLQAAQSLGAGAWILISDILLPSMLPFAFHGIRLGVGLGWFCVVASEMMGSSNGLGFGVQLHSLNLDMPSLYVYLLAIALVGTASDTLLLLVDRCLNRWRIQDSYV